MNELIAGLSHPLHGGDHLLAMLAVGFWGARYAGPSRWVLPCAFVGFTWVGALPGVQLPHVEPMIALSVLVLGLASAIATRLPVAAAAAVVALFAVFHGHAHFMELAAGAAWGPYVAGMVLATALLHAAGMGLALGLGRLRAWLPRSLGAATALAGAWMLVS